MLRVPITQRKYLFRNYTTNHTTPADRFTTGTRVGAPLIATAPVIATYLYIYSQLSYIEPYSAILISNISATRVGNIILTAHACFVHTNKDRHFNFSGCHQTLVSLQLSLRNPW
jgi:hypothetical protein